MMYEEIQEHYPLEFALRDQDKYRYRYPKGEVWVLRRHMSCSPYSADGILIPSFKLFHDSLPVIRRPGAATGACDHGAREAGERSGHLSPGCHALSSGIFPGQACRWVQKTHFSDHTVSNNLTLKLSDVVFLTTEELPYLNCSLHTVLKLTPIAYGELCHKCIRVVL